MRKLALLIITVLAVISCNKEKNEENLKPGYFVLTELKNSNLKKATTDTIKTEFLLGDLKASKEFYFILSNGGDEPIYNVSFESSNPAFQVYPQMIKELPGSKTNNYILPLVSLSVIHGTRLNGVGYANLLNMDLNSSTITVKGKIVENEDSTEIKTVFTFRLNAKIMDVSMFDNGKEIDITKPSGSVSSNLGGLGFVRFSMISSNNLTIKNTGNVPIKISTITQDKFGNEIKGTP